ncbi:PQQ-binding-like beta-propeller repeat protein [Calothrix membranacea FACHB-236]|nr:PQQ-binding-like beta-propeller repeat protein [Calothrix membranacea FACHB-236]
MVETTDKSLSKKSYKVKAYLGRYPYNLVNSGNLEKYYQTLTDFDFINAKINHPEFGVQSLIEDYDLIDSAETSENFKTLKLLQGALRLSAHVLVTDKQQLASQLHGRLLHENMPDDIQALLRQIQQQTTTPWLRPVTPSLTPPGGRLIRTLTGHSSFVNAIALTPDGQRVISGSSDNSLKVWNLQTGEELFTLKGHRKPISAIAVTPNGKQVISASRDNTLKVWNLETGNELFTLSGHSSLVNAIAVTPNGKQVISASWGNTLKVWNLETGKELFTFPSERYANSGHSNWVNAIAVTPNGKQVISASDDNTLKVWNLETGKEGFFSLIRNFFNIRQKFTLRGHSYSVKAIAVTPNGKQVISVSLDCTLKVWNLETGKELFTLSGHSDLVQVIAVTPNGKQVISASDDNTLKVWNLETGKELFTLSGHSHSVNAIAVTLNDKQVISASLDSTLKVWNLETGEVIATFIGEYPMSCCAVAPDGVSIVAGDSSGKVHFLRFEGMRGK